MDDKKRLKLMKKLEKLEKQRKEAQQDLLLKQAVDKESKALRKAKIEQSKTLKALGKIGEAIIATAEATAKQQQTKTKKKKKKRKKKQQYHSIFDMGGGFGEL